MAIITDRPTSRNTPEPLRPPSQPAKRGTVLAVIVAIVVLGLVVVVGVKLTQHSAPATGGPTPQVTAPGVSASAPPASTPSPTVLGPSANPADWPAAQVNPPSLAGAYTPDPTVVMKTLSAYIDWVFAHPNPALLDNYMLPSSRTYQGLKAELTTMVTNHWHGRPSVTTLEWMKALGPFTPALGSQNGHPNYVGTNIKVVVAAPPPASDDVFNDAGQVVSSFHNPTVELMLSIALAQGKDGQFRISDEVADHPVGGVAAFES